MELRQYLAIVRKWFWLILLAPLLASGASYYFSLRITPIYRAQTTILVGRLLDDSATLENLGLRSNALQTATDLSQAYAMLATQPPILQATAEAAHWPGDWQSLFFQVSALSAGNQMLTISVMDSDPVMARVLANELANQLIVQGPIGTQRRQTDDQHKFLSDQLAELKKEIEGGQSSVTTLNNQAALENDPARLKDLNERIASLQVRVSDWQKNYASLSNLLSSGSNLFVTVLAPARVPTSPISPNIQQNILFAALAGLVLAGGGILLLEYLDDTIKSPDDVQRVLKLATLGAITRMAGIRDPQDQLITARHPRSPVAEAFRVLRTNLRFTGIKNSSGALLVTSSGPGEGKTTTAANLAIVVAQSGRRVVLVDTDLRRPAVHKLFGLSNSIGLCNSFLDEAASLESILQPTEVEGLRVVTSGPLPPNPAEILDSQQMMDILATLRARFDLVILDSSPVLAVADASILGSRCSGVLLVIDAGRARTDDVKRTLETLQQTGAKVSGAVLNRLGSGHASGYYYDYRYDVSPERPGRNGHEQKRERHAEPRGSGIDV